MEQESREGNLPEPWSKGKFRFTGRVLIGRGVVLQPWLEDEDTESTEADLARNVARQRSDAVNPAAVSEQLR